MKFKHRLYQGESDDQPVRDLLSQSFALTQHPFYTVDPPNWERLSSSLRIDPNKHTVHLWCLHEHPKPLLIGIAIYTAKSGGYSYLVHPGYPGMDDMICELIETEHRDAQGRLDETKLLRCSVCEGNTSQIVTLTRRGYTKGEKALNFRVRSLVGDFPPSVLKTGYDLGKFQSLQAGQVQERAEAESEIFDRNTSIEFIRTLQHSPLYLPKLDLVITILEGGIAAFCTLWFVTENRVGFIEPMGTLASHRRIGLGTALMLEGFRRLQRLGATTVFLGNRVDNMPANKLYESVGMGVFDQEHRWYKAI